MAITPYAGTSGRLKSIPVSPVLTADSITFTGVTATVNEITGWQLTISKPGGQPEVLTFESDSDAQGNLYPTLIRGGVARWTATVQGLMNGTAGAGVTDTTEQFPIGAAVVADFVYQKGGAKGFFGCNGVVTDFQTSQQVGPQPAPFTCTIAGSGALPAVTV